MVSLCAPDAIPLELLAVSFPSRSDRPLAFEAAIRDLRRFSLVTFESELPRLNIHRLLKTLAFATAERQIVLELLDSMMESTARLLPESPNNEWASFDLILPHAESFLAIALGIGRNTPTTVRLLEMRGGYLNVRGQYGLALQVLSEALKIAQELWPEGNPATARVLNALGNSCFYQARFDQAEIFYSDALSLREKLLEATHPAIGTSLTNLATLYLDQGRYPESGEFFQRALKHRENSLGHFHPDVATAACNFANLLLAEGRFSDAEKHFLRAIEIRRHPDLSGGFLTGWVLTNYGELKLDQNQPEKALEFLTEALTIFSDTVRMDHPYSLMAMHNLAKRIGSLGIGTSQSSYLRR